VMARRRKTSKASLSSRLKECSARHQRLRSLGPHKTRRYGMLTLARRTHEPYE
jgi:hypothetical protein